MTILHDIPPGTTAKQYLQARGGRNLTHDEAVKLYWLRDQDVRLIAAKALITAADILTLDRGGRFTIACNHFAKCDTPAQEALLQDEHHSVRSAAKLSSLTAIN